MKFGFYTTYIGSPFILISMILFHNPEKYNNLAFLVPMLFGVFSYTWLLWQFVLSARPKFIEKHIGLDKLFRFHGMMAIVSILLIFAHKTLFELFFSESILTKLGSIALFLFASIAMISLIFMASSVLKNLPLI